MIGPDDIENGRDVNELISSISRRDISWVRTPTGNEMALYFDHGGWEWRYEVKYQGNQWLFIRDDDGDWDEVWKNHR